MNKKCFLFLYLLVLFFLAGCSEVKNVKINGPSTIEMGFEETYFVTINNIEYSADDFYWTTSDRTVLLCNGSKIKPLKEGICDITAVKKDDGTVVAKYTISVVDALVKGIEIITTEGYSLYQNDVLILDYKTTPLDVAAIIEWKSSDETIAKVDDTGCITGINPGKAVITVKSGRAEASVEVVVKEIVTELKLKTSTNLVVGQAVKFEFNIEDAIVTLDKTDVVEKIGNYYFTKKEGEFTIEAHSKSLSGLSDNFTFTVGSAGLNKIHSESEVDGNEVLSLKSELTTAQLISQKYILNTRVIDFKEDDDGVYFSDSQTGRLNINYLNDYFEGTVFGNYQFSRYSNDYANDINLLYKHAKASSTIGSFNIIDAEAMNSFSLYSYKMNNYGGGKLTLEQIEKYYTTIAKQIKELGYNVIIESGYNATDNYNRFSYDRVEDNYISTLVRKIFEKQGIIVCYQVKYNGEYKQMQDQLIELVNNDVDMIQIDYNYENFDGSLNIVDYIRKTLQYEGLIYLCADYSNFWYEDDSYNAAYKYFKNALMEGVDLINCDVEFTSNSWYRYGYNELVFPACNAMIGEYNSDNDFKNVINDSFDRIVEKKIQYKIVDGVTIQDKKYDFSSYDSYVSSILKNTYTICDDYVPLNKDARIVIFGTTFSTGDYFSGRVQYNFVNALNGYLKERKYNDIVAYNDYYSGLNAYKDNYQENDQVVIMINAQSYSYYVNDQRVKVNMDELVGEIKQLGIDNIKVILLNSIEPTLYEEYQYICVNKNYNMIFAGLTDCIVDGK